ncbi:MAG TPA: FecR family protein [Chitinophagaceae bacterium]|nr:FecR family protein [Chitinophagaceae bacterium]
MLKDFKNYKLEDFIADESFVNYLLRTNECDIIFWEQWVTSNRGKRLIVKEATDIICSLSFTLSEKEYNHEFEKLHSAINKTKPRAVFQLLKRNHVSGSQHHFKKAVQYIVFCLLIFIIGTATYLLTQQHENKISELDKTINSGNKSITFTLSDSTVVTLAANSTLQYPSTFKGSNREVYLIGEAGFNVKRNKKFPFKVHNKNIVATVLGTIFNIKKSGDSAIVVELLKGKLKVDIEDTAASQNSILLNPDEKATYVYNGKHFFKTSNLTHFNVSFYKNSFEEIALDIKNIFNKTLINNSGNTRWRFTGEFKNASADEVIENICLIKKLHSEETGDTIFIHD